MENQSKSNALGKGKLYQVSLLQGLTYGDYRGSVTIEELLQNGDTGLGTFNRLNGKLVLLDGTCTLFQKTEPRAVTLLESTSLMQHCACATSIHLI